MDALSFDWRLAAAAAVALYALWVANTALRECSRLRRELEATKQWLGEVDRRESIHADELYDQVREHGRRLGPAPSPSNMNAR